MDGFPLLASPALAAAVFAIVVAAAIVQSGLGMGFGLTAAPLLALIEPELVPAATLWIGLLTSSWGAAREISHVQWNEVVTGAFGRLAGVLAGSLLLASIPDKKIFMLTFGTMVGLAVLLSASGWRIAFNRFSLIAMATVSGLMGTITSVGAPPLALIYQNRPSAEARPTLAAFFAVGCALSLAGLHLAGWAGWHDLALALFMVPPMMIGMVTGKRFQSRFDRRYRPAMLAVAAVAAVILIARGLA